MIMDLSHFGRLQLGLLPSHATKKSLLSGAGIDSIINSIQINLS